jgi:predicted DNA-binding protein YlxM (UPF0122 family)
MTAREAGTMSINVATTEPVNFNSKLTAAAIQSMAPRANRRNHTVYSIDNLAAIACDIDDALEHALDDKARRRLLMIMYYGYEQQEVAEMEGVSKQAINTHLERCYEKMSAYLESPKQPKQVPAYKFEEYTHRRKYTNPGYNAPVR